MVGKRRELKNVCDNALPLYLFHQGTNYSAYDYMGAHFGVNKNKSGVFFRTWAPHAEKISVVGDFNDWNIDSNPMEKISDGGVFETFIPNVKEFDKYKSSQRCKLHFLSVGLIAIIILYGFSPFLLLFEWK
jgi:hypothetical protein